MLERESGNLTTCQNFGFHRQFVDLSRLLPGMKIGVWRKPPTLPDGWHKYGVMSKRWRKRSWKCGCSQDQFNNLCITFFTEVWRLSVSSANPRGSLWSPQTSLARLIPGCLDGTPGQDCTQYSLAFPDLWSMAIERRCQEVPQKQQAGSTTEQENISAQTLSPCTDRCHLPPHARLHDTRKTSHRFVPVGGLMGMVGEGSGKVPLCV